MVFKSPSAPYSTKLQPLPSAGAALVLYAGAVCPGLAHASPTTCMFFDAPLLKGRNDRCLQGTLGTVYVFIILGPATSDYSSITNASSTAE